MQETQETRFDPWVRKIPWRRKWQPTPVFLPGESHGQGSLVGYSPWGYKELDTIEQLSAQRLQSKRPYNHHPAKKLTIVNNQKSHLCPNHPPHHHPGSTMKTLSITKMPVTLITLLSLLVFCIKTYFVYYMCNHTTAVFIEIIFDVLCKFKV